MNAPSALGLLAVVLGLGLAGCASTPIDGSKVARLDVDGGVPSCGAVCRRLWALCGYAPEGCNVASDAGSYCGNNMDDTFRTCVGVAASCQEAWTCSNAPPADAGDDAGSEADAGAPPGDAKGD